MERRVSPEPALPISRSLHEQSTTSGSAVPEAAVGRWQIVTTVTARLADEGATLVLRQGPSARHVSSRCRALHARDRSTCRGSARGSLDVALVRPPVPFLLDLTLQAA